MRRDSAFRELGSDAADELDAIDARLSEIADAMDSEFPLDAGQSRTLLHDLRERLEAIHAAEVDAAEALSDLL
jgi:hypothetical protein